MLVAGLVPARCIVVIPAACGGFILLVSPAACGGFSGVVVEQPPSAVTALTILQKKPTDGKAQENGGSPAAG